MAKQFLDYEGLDYYDGLIKQFINNGLNDTLQSALEHFSGALIPRGVIKNINGATYIDLRSEALEFYKAKTGDVYFIGEDDLKLTYVDTTGTVVQDEDVDKGDAIVCIVSADIATNGSVVSEAQWATLQSNWSVVPNSTAKISFGAAPTPLKLAEIGGEEVGVTVDSASNVASQLRGSLGDEQAVVMVQKGTGKPAKNIATSISENSAGNLVPTDKAVYDFVSQHTPNAVTKLDWAREDDGSISEPLSLDITGGTDAGWLSVPVADGSKSGVMTPKLHQELKESVNTVTPLIDDEGSLTIENAFNNGDTFSFPVPLASEYNDGAMSKEDKETLDEVAKEIDDKADYRGMYVSTGDTAGALKICTLTLTSPWRDLYLQFTLSGRNKRNTAVDVCLGSAAEGVFYEPYCVLYTRNSTANGYALKGFVTYTESGFVCEIWTNLSKNEKLHIAKKTIGGDASSSNLVTVEWGMNLAPEMPSEEDYDYILNPETPEWRGNASTASKLGTTTVGSATKPIYLNNGTATPINYSIEKSVPANAVFTDTHHTAKNVVSNTASTTANTATNGNVHLNLVENGAVRSSVRLNGTGGTKITANGSGVVIIDSPNYGIATETTNGLISSSTAKKLAELDSTYPMLYGGAVIPEGADLNDVAYLEVGTYHCYSNNRAEGLLNSPTKSAFIMWVNSGLGNKYSLSGANVYRVRIIQTYTAKCYIQQLNGANGVYTFGAWRKITDEDDIKGLVKDVNVRHDENGNVLVETEDYEGDFSSVSIPVATDVAAGVMTADMFKMLDFGTGTNTYVLPYHKKTPSGNTSSSCLLKLGVSGADISYNVWVRVSTCNAPYIPGHLIVQFYNYSQGGVFYRTGAASTISAFGSIKIFNKKDGYTYCYIPSIGDYAGFAITVSADKALSEKPISLYEELPADDEIVLSADIPVTNIAYEPEERNKVSGLISGSVAAGNASMLEGIGASGFTRTISGTVGALGEATVRYIKIARITKSSSSTANLAAVKINGVAGAPSQPFKIDVALSNRGSKQIVGYCKKTSTWDYGDIGINDAGEICMIFKTAWCMYTLSVSVSQNAVIEYDDDFTPTDTNFALLSESNNVIFSNRNTNAVTEAEKAANDGNGANIAQTYLTKAQVNTANSSAKGVKVAFSGTMGNLSPAVTVTTGGVTSTSTSVVSGKEVHTALSGNAYYARISETEIDNLFA